MVRLAYLVSHPIQYQAPLLREVAGERSIDLTVFFQSDISVRSFRDAGFGETISWDVSLLEGYRHEFLPALGGTDRLSAIRPLSVGLKKRLIEGRFDALWVHGYASQCVVRAVYAARRRGMPVLMRGESNAISAPRSSGKERLKRFFLGRLFGACDALLYVGTLNRDYYRSYGVPDEKLFPMPYAVDNAFFRRRASEAAEMRESFRASLGLAPGRPVILYASKLSARKHPMDLLEAYIRLSPDGAREPAPYLLFVGNGEERRRLEERLKATGWSSIRLLGFRNQTELPAFYDLCDVFILPSVHEPWGLVINEAMNAGKPVIVSDQVGCGPDLVRDGKNGFVFPARDVEALSHALKAVTEDRARAQAMGEKSREIVERWGFREDIAGLRAALEQVVKSG